MKEVYIKHLSTLELSGLCFRVLLLLNIQSYTQSSIAILLHADRQAINKVFNKLKSNGLIELVKVEGKNKFYKAVVDVKRLTINIPGQTKFL
ncbi:transcriptional regulator [Clostridium paraputrificum]|uniref:transcriptional regulator n=1 Tax=Clostridium paraputrificum TaxID=29363 RepID=UPI0034A2BB60